MSMATKKAANPLAHLGRHEPNYALDWEVVDVRPVPLPRATLSAEDRLALGLTAVEPEPEMTSDAREALASLVERRRGR